MPTPTPLTDLLGDDLDPMERLTTAGRWPEQLAELMDLVAEVLAGVQQPLPHQARHDAACIVRRLAESYGGSSFYWPKPDSLERVLRDMTIWADFDGTVHGRRGIAALAKRHALSEMRIHQILTRERTLHRARVQLSLPLADEK
jgi:Mor family transcriptional regulator